MSAADLPSPPSRALAAASVVPNELILRPTGILDPVVEVRPRGSQLDDLIAEAAKRAKRNERTLATVLTRVGAERLSELLNDTASNRITCTQVPSCWSVSRSKEPT